MPSHHHHHHPKEHDIDHFSFDYDTAGGATLRDHAAAGTHYDTHYGTDAVDHLRDWLHDYDAATRAAPTGDGDSAERLVYDFTVAAARALCVVSADINTGDTWDAYIRAGVALDEWDRAASDRERD